MDFRHAPNKVLVLVTVALIVTAACSVKTLHLNEGRNLLFSGHYDKAIAYFERALAENPGNSEIRNLLYRTKLSSYFLHLSKAREYREHDNISEAIREYQIVLKIFPGDSSVLKEYEALKKPVSETGRIFRSTIEAPVSLNVDAQKKISLNVKSGTPMTQIFKILGKPFGINFIFDKDFRDFIYSIEVNDIGFFEILNQLCLIAGSRYRVVDPVSVLVYPDNTFKKRVFDLRGVRVFYLNNISADNAKALLMAVFRDEQPLLQDDPNINALIVKADLNTLQEIEKFLFNVDKKKSEVELDVEILEVNRSLINKIGADFGTVLTQLKAGQETSTDSGQVINSTINLNNPGSTNFFMTLPTVAFNLLSTNDKNKIIAKPNLRGIEGEDIHFMVGDELPVPQTQFQPYAAGGLGTVPQTTYGYRKVGVDIKITPTIHRTDEVTIRMKLSMDFVSGFVDDIFPVLGKRELDNTIRLREGETSIIGGFIRDEVRGSLRGIPGLSRLPLIGKLFGNSDRTINQTDLLFAITPRIIRKTDISDINLETIWSDSGSSGNQVNSQAEPQNQQGTVAPPTTMENSISITPARRRVPADTIAYFTLRLNTTAAVNALSLSGTISGSEVSIEELKTDFFKTDEANVLKHYSGTSFDAGYTFMQPVARSSILAQLKVKFGQKGEYTINLTNITAFGSDRQRIEIKPSQAFIDVY